MSQDVGKLRCRIVQVPLYIQYFNIDYDIALNIIDWSKPRMCIIFPFLKNYTKHSKNGIYVFITVTYITQ